LTATIYDGSDAAKHAIAVSAPLLAPARAVLLHVWLPLSTILLWNPLIGSSWPLSGPAGEIDDACRAAGQRLADEGTALALEAGFDVEPVIAESRHGAWRTVVHVADERDARTVVVGSHGRSPMSSALLGGVAAGVAHHSARPVLVIPAPQRTDAPGDRREHGLGVGVG
jgi:nucleotide-binding universal stress UspA family protein